MWSIPIGVFAAFCKTYGSQTVDDACSSFQLVLRNLFTEEKMSATGKTKSQHLVSNMVETFRIHDNSDRRKFQHGTSALDRFAYTLHFPLGGNKPNTGYGCYSNLCSVAL